MSRPGVGVGLVVSRCQWGFGIGRFRLKAGGDKK